LSFLCHATTSSVMILAQLNFFAQFCVADPVHFPYIRRSIGTVSFVFEKASKTFWQCCKEKDHCHHNVCALFFCTSSIYDFTHCFNIALYHPNDGAIPEKGYA
ncbi:MAG: hypothetical protein FWC40_02035, partial [Proteobacteria bacterium]|nr:hypothetical protein [Pseudomonadota bacterium]